VIVDVEAKVITVAEIVALSPRGKNQVKQTKQMKVLLLLVYFCAKARPFLSYLAT
jgi:hypothetical protein